MTDLAGHKSFWPDTLECSYQQTNIYCFHPISHPKILSSIHKSRFHQARSNCQLMKGAKRPQEESHGRTGTRYHPFCSSQRANNEIRTGKSICLRSVLTIDRRADSYLRSSCISHTSTRPLHTLHIAGSGPQSSSHFSSFAYSLRKAGT